MVRRLQHGPRMPSPTTLAYVAVPLGLLGCTSYSPGSFRHAGRAFTGQTTTIACLDLGVAGDRDAVAPGPIVDYQFGNRCDHPIAIDLGAVRATGRTGDGRDVALVAYDPYHTLRALRLEARSSGRERLEYRNAADFGTDLVSVCLSLDGITDAAPTGQQICVANGNRVAEVSP